MSLIGVTEDGETVDFITLYGLIGSMKDFECALPPANAPHPLPTLVLYHANCPDGFTAAWVYWKKLGRCARYVPVAHGDPPPSDVDGEDVVVVDFSFPREVSLEMASRARSFRVLDHHISAQRDLGDLPFFHFDIDRSGAGLAWQDIHGEMPFPLLVSCVEDRDLYRWTVPGSADVLHVLDTIPYDFGRWDALANRLEEDPVAVQAEGALMRERFEAAANRLLPHARPVSMGGASGLALNAPMEFADYVGNTLASQAEFGFTWYVDRLGRVHGSWRSKVMDVSVLAESFGGGGHKGASGARLTIAQMATLLGCA